MSGLLLELHHQVFPLSGIVAKLPAQIFEKRGLALCLVCGNVVAQRTLSVSDGSLDARYLFFKEGTAVLHLL